MAEVFSLADLPEQVMARLRSARGATWASLDDAAARLGVRKLRLAGVYDDRLDGWFMLRTRTPGGILTADQADVLAYVACHHCRRARTDETWGDWLEETPEQFVEITTRQDIQLHWIRLEALPEVWERFERVGLTSAAACGDTLRNVTSCPAAGVNASEWIDVRPIVRVVSELTATHPKLATVLPRKFKVAITGCRSDCVVARTHDLAFTPARRDGEIGFNVWAGGGLSDSPRVASPLDMFAEPAQVVDVVAAALALYAAEGDVEHKAVNRFRMLVHALGDQAIAAGIRRRARAALPAAGQDLSEWVHDDHLGVRVQPDGAACVGLCVPLGRLTASQLGALADLARRHGDATLRLTQRQNILLPGVQQVGALLDEPLLEHLRPDPNPFERAVLGCTSAPFCKFGIVNTKAHGAALIEHLRRHVPEAVWPSLSGLRIHVSGCKASCAQTHAAHIGLRATAVRDGDEYVEGFDVATGGDVAHGRLARWVAGEVAASLAYDLVTDLIRTGAAPEPTAHAAKPAPVRQ